MRERDRDRYKNTEKHRDEVKARAKAWKEEHPEQAKAKNKEWRETINSTSENWTQHTGKHTKNRYT